MKDLMIILCVLLVILTLISILGGSIRYNEDPGPKIIQPDAKPTPTTPSKEAFNTEKTESISDKLAKILKGNKVKQEHEHFDLKKNTNAGASLEPFQGYEFAMF